MSSIPSSIDIHILIGTLEIYHQQQLHTFTNVIISESFVSGKGYQPIAYGCLGKLCGRIDLSLKLTNHTEYDRHIKTFTAESNKAQAAFQELTKKYRSTAEEEKKQEKKKHPITKMKENLSKAFEQHRAIYALATLEEKLSILHAYSAQK